MLPAITGSGTSTMIILKSAAGLTVVTAVAKLFPGTGSTWVATTRAVLVILPNAFGNTLMTALALLPLARVPKLQIIFPFELAKLPWESVAEIKLTVPGSTLVMKTPEADEGPLSVTTTV